jgi:hypothetical protein
MTSNTLKLPTKSAQTKPNIATPDEKQKGKMTVRQKADQAEVEARTQREMLAARERRIAARSANLAVLAERFPSIFNPEKPLPLAIGCAKAIRAAIGMSWSQLEDLIRWWTTRPEYLAALAAGGPRYNLDGSEAGIVAENHRVNAYQPRQRIRRRRRAATDPVA